MDEKKLEAVLTRVATESANTVAAKVGAKFDEHAKGLKDLIQQNANASLQNHQKTNGRLDGFERMLTSLWKKVHGSDPPPPTDGNFKEERKSAKDHVPLTERVTSSELELSAMRSEVIATNAKLDLVVKAMGIKGKDEKTALGELVRWLMKSREGQKFVLAGFAAFTSLITALGTTYALATGRLPVPTSPVPQATAAPHVNFTAPDAGAKDAPAQTP